MSGPEVMALLNGYVGAMAGAVFENGGLIDKYLGDGVMGVFGVLPDADEGAAAVTRAALAIRSRLAQLNCERRDRGESAIRHGVGIHTGEVVLGAVGIPERSDYTAVGDAVNTASRLEALTKQHAVDVMLSEETVRRLPPGEFGVCSLGPAMLRGRRAQIVVYQLM
jgi:adenylate cyclase